jgi:hypothetical protein
VNADRFVSGRRLVKEIRGRLILQRHRARQSCSVDGRGLVIWVMLL